MKKHRIHIAVTALVWMLALAIRAQAAEGDLVRLDQEGNLSIVSGHAAQDKICSLQLGLSVDAAEAEKIEFRFQGNDAKVREFRYDREEKRLNLYLSGTDPLFAEQTDTLALGKVVALDQNGNAVSATVSVVVNSLQYVYGGEVKTMENAELPGTVQIAGSSRPTPEPSPTQQPAPTAQPSQPAPTAQPSQPSQTAQPSQPAPTAQPSQPSQTAQPSQPSPTAQPSQPAQTPRPVRPTQTARPSHGSSESGDLSESGVQEGTEGAGIPEDQDRESENASSGVGSEPGNLGSNETDQAETELEIPKGIGTTQEVIVFSVVVGLILILTVVITAAGYQIHRKSRRKENDEWY